MEPASEAPTRQPEKHTHAKPKASHHANAHDTRESWLRSAMLMLAPMFDQAGHPLPDTRRAAIGFTSKGGKGNCVGECWHSAASSDAHFEIFIRPDKADPVEVLGILAHELVHAAVPIGSGHGPVYKNVALKIGLEGKMRHAMPGMHLQEKLIAMAADLGPFPHASIDLQWRESAPRKKQKTNMLKAWCAGGLNGEGEEEGCEYVVRLTRLHAEKGAPLCGVHKTEMRIEWPEPEDGEMSEDGDATPDESETGSFKAPLPSEVAAPEYDAATSFKAPERPRTSPAGSAADDLDDAMPQPITPRRSIREATPEAEPSPGFRWAIPDEVHAPGISTV